MTHETQSGIITYEELENTDTITVDLVPERKGLILKHCEYYVSSRRHGTTVTRRYNEFSQLYDILMAKYPYRAISRLPPKRVVMGGGSPMFLSRRRAALQRWLSLVARHPVLAHDADVRAFLCEAGAKLERPKFDEFTLAGEIEYKPNEPSTEELQDTFTAEHEYLKLVHLGLNRLLQIFERVESRCESEHGDIRELGAALTALASAGGAGGLADRLRAAAALSSQSRPPPTLGCGILWECGDALAAALSLCGRMSRGLHAERAAAARHVNGDNVLRQRHRYALVAVAEEGRLARAYALAALQAIPTLFRSHATSQASLAAVWADLYNALTGNNATTQNRPTVFT